MSIIIRLQNLPWAADSGDIRRYFAGLSIPEGGVHIVGGEMGDAFIAFSTDEDARLAMEKDGGKIHEMQIKLLLSSRTEMMRVIEKARQQNLALQSQYTMPLSQPMIPVQQPVMQMQQPLMSAQQPIMPAQQPIMSAQQPMIPGQQPMLSVPQSMIPVQQPIISAQQPLVPIQQSSRMAVAPVLEGDRKRGRSPSPSHRRSRDKSPPRDRRRSPDRRDRSKRDRSRSPTRRGSRDIDRRGDRFKRDDRRSYDEGSRYRDDRHSDREDSKRHDSDSLNRHSSDGYRQSSNHSYYGSSAPAVTSTGYNYDSSQMMGNSGSFYNFPANEKPNALPMDKQSAPASNAVSASSTQAYMQQPMSFTGMPYDQTPQVGKEAVSNPANDPMRDKHRRSRFDAEYHSSQEPPFYPNQNKKPSENSSFGDKRGAVQDFRPPTRDAAWPPRSEDQPENMQWAKKRAALLEPPTSKNGDSLQVVPMDLEQSPPRTPESKNPFGISDQYVTQIAPVVFPTNDMPKKEDMVRRGPDIRNNKNNNQWREPPITVEVRGIPPDIRVNEMMDLFPKISIPSSNICIKANNQGTEKVFIRFNHPSECVEVLNRQPYYIRNYCCQVSPCPVEAFEAAVASSNSGKPLPKPVQSFFPPDNPVYFRRMKRTGQDSLQSWLIVIYCSLMAMLLYGVVRLSGIMFVASMELFEVDRQSASLPYILCDAIQAMAGPVTGLLSLKFGARPVMMVGSFIAAAGIGACFFAENIETVTVFWGFVYGVGFGLSSLLLPTVVTQHFVKRRATAISLMYFGSYVGFSFLPSIADFLIHNYGLSGTYLFLSGFLLQCVPLSMLLRNPDTSVDEKNLGSELSRAASISIINEYPSRTSKDPTPIYDSIARFKMNHPDFPPRRSSSKIRFSIDVSNFGDSNAIKQDNHGLKNEGFVHDNTTKYDLKVKPEDSESINTEKETADMNQTIQHPSITRLKSCFGRENEGFSYEDSPKSVRSHQSATEVSKPVAKFKYTDDQEKITKTTPKLMNFERIDSSPNINPNPTSKKCDTEIPYTKDGEHRDSFSSELFPTFVNRIRSSVTIDGESCFEHPLKINRKTSAMLGNALMRRASVISRAEVTISKGLKVFFEPIFLMVLFGNAVYTFCFIAFITVIVDFTKDIGVSESDGKFVIMAFSIASNIGLLSFGWVTDGGYLSLTNFAALMLFLRTITLCAIPYSNGFIMLTSVVSVQGFVESSLANMFPLIVAEYYRDEIHELALSCTLFLSGPMFMCTPLLIGFFRDDLGSYLYLFLLMAALSLICSILHFIAPVLAKCRCGRNDWILRKR